MKLKQLLFFFVLLLLVQGCEESKPKSDLSISKDRVCLNSYKQAKCITEKQRPIWLHMLGDSIHLDLVKDLRIPNLNNFPQFAQAQIVPIGEFKLKKEGKGIVLYNDSLRIVGKGKMGIMMFLDDQGQFYAATMDSDECPKYQLGLTGGEIMRGGSSMGTAMVLTSRVSFVDADGNAMIEIIAENDIASRVIPNDTGTEIVIVDNFRLNSVNCCEGGYESCCPNGRAAELTGKDKEQKPKRGLLDKIKTKLKPGPTLDYKASLETLIGKLKKRGYSLAAGGTDTIDGWNERETHDVDDVCIWEDCHKIIVVDCSTGKITCYDTIECPVMIRLNGDGSVSVLTPSGCDLAKAVQAC